MRLVETVRGGAVDCAVERMLVECDDTIFESSVALILYHVCWLPNTGEVT